MHIVVIGGGAGGLELATRLGRKFGRKKHRITLIDRNNTHLWKPLLHEVASGSLDMGVDSLSYRAHAYNHHFKFNSFLFLVPCSFVFRAGTREDPEK